MSGKRFYSPAATGPGYSQLYRSSGSRPRAGAEPQRGAAATRRATSRSPHSAEASRHLTQSSTPGQRYVSPSYLHGSLTPGGVGPGPGQSGPLLAAPGGSLMNTSVASPADVHHMLNDLVEISEAIATYISQESNLRGDGLPATSQQQQQQQQAVLKAQEIERIVKRVEAHFLAKMNALQSANKDLERQVKHLQSKLTANGNGNGNGVATVERPLTGSDAVPEVRDGLREQGEALDELDKTWESLRGDNTQVDQLRRILVAEKRQRLLVEEQTQRLTEQHAKVVGTLERRLRKQEDQLRDLISALDRNGHPSSGSPTTSISGSPENSSSNAARGVTTPRHLLRQQLAQHQQTQKALQEYQQHLTNATLPVDVDDDADDLGLAQVQRTLDSIKNSQPLTFVHTPTSASAPASSSVPISDVTPVQRTRNAPVSRGATQADVDEISAFLDNITKELETISEGD